MFLHIAIPVFALLNAFSEEVVYRGVFQESLKRVFKNRQVILILQASAFAIAHFAFGFPNGLIGYLMVFVYGYLLGYLRERTNGLLTPYITHVFADLTIGYFMCFYAILT